MCGRLKRSAATNHFKRKSKVGAGDMGGGGRVDLVPLHPSIRCPRPQARDRLCVCGRPDYRPVPPGVGAIRPPPPALLVLSAPSENGGQGVCGNVAGSRVNLR